MKYYYENILAQQNYVAKPNIAWAADFTSFELINGRKIYVFICIDIFSNKIVVSLFRTKQFTSYDIIQKLNTVSFIFLFFSSRIFKTVVTVNNTIPYIRLLLKSGTEYKAFIDMLWISLVFKFANLIHLPLFVSLIQPTFFHRNQFQVLFEIIKTYSSIDLRKEFNITKFLDNYPSVLSNQNKRQIQEYFIHYLKILHQEGKLQDKVLDLSSNKVFQITDLNSSHSQIAVFENIKIKFL